MSHRHKLLCMLLLMYPSVAATGNTMTFDGGPHGAFPPITEDGLTVTTIDNHGWEPRLFSDPDAGGGFGLHMEGGVIRFDMGGGVFHLEELFYDVVDDPTNDNVITFSSGDTHKFFGNWAEDLSIDLSGVAAAKNISWFTVTLPGTGYCSQLDYVKFTPVAIPAPGAILLGGIGVSLVGWMRRRKTL